MLRVSTRPEMVASPMKEEATLREYPPCSSPKNDVTNPIQIDVMIWTSPKANNIAASSSAEQRDKIPIFVSNIPKP